MTTTPKALPENKREAFESWLAKNPDARHWNTTDAMFAAFIGAVGSLASAGGVESAASVANYLAMRRLAQGLDREHIHMLNGTSLRISDLDGLLAALSKEREVADGLRAELEAAYDMLARIGDFAHDKSTGPAIPDALWEVRGMAYAAVALAIDTAKDRSQ